MSAWDPNGALVPMQTQPRTAAQLSQAPDVATQAQGPGSLYYDPSASVLVYYALSADGTRYVALGSTDNPRAARFILLSGSETARGNCILPCDPAMVTGDGSTLFVTTKVPHLLHSGGMVTVSSEDAIAPALNNGIVTFDNLFAYGPITVTGGSTFTMPYSGLAGTSTVQFVINPQSLLSPNGKYTEFNRRKRGALQQVANFATGSNNTANLRARIPLIAAMIMAGQATELWGGLGIGNTLIYGLNHNWTIEQMLAQAVPDVTYMVQSVAAAGGSTTCNLSSVQLTTNGFETSGIRRIYEAFRQLAANPANRMRITDDFTMFVDPTTGQGRQRWYRGNDRSDPTHPSNAGCVMASYNYLHGQRDAYPVGAERLMRSVLDTQRADPDSYQLMDGFLPGDNTQDAHTLDSNAIGLVPTSVLGVQTSGSGGRGIQFSYLPRGDGRGCDLRGDFTGQAGDTFSILLNNPGARDLKFLMAPGKRYWAGIDCACVAGISQVASVDVYMGLTASYGLVTSHKGYLAADSLNATLYPDGPLTQARRSGDCMPEFTTPLGLTAVQGIVLTVTVTLAATGTGYVRLGLPTLRQLN